MTFYQGKLHNSVDISKVTNAEQFSDTRNLYHANLYVFKALWKF